MELRCLHLKPTSLLNIAASHNILAFPHSLLCFFSFNHFVIVFRFYKDELDMKVDYSVLDRRKPKDCGYPECFSFQRPIVQSVTLA